MDTSVFSPCWRMIYSATIRVSQLPLLIKSWKTSGGAWSRTSTARIREESPQWNILASCIFIDCLDLGSYSILFGRWLHLAIVSFHFNIPLHTSDLPFSGWSASASSTLWPGHARRFLSHQTCLRAYWYVRHVLWSGYSKKEARQFLDLPPGTALISPPMLVSFLTNNVQSIMCTARRTFLWMSNSCYLIRLTYVDFEIFLNVSYQFLPL